MLPQDQVMKEALKCSGCGFCLSACPVYRVLGVETFSSRGRMDTIRGMLLGELKLTPRMEEILSTCLMCQACEAACPPGASAHKVLLEARHRAVKEKGMPWAKSLAFRRLLKDRKALARALKLVRKIQGPPPGAKPHDLRHLPTLFSGLAGGRALPPIAQKPLRERFPERVEPVPGVGLRGRVGFFPGCYMEFVDTSIGDAAIRVLSREGFEVFFPREQVCCGAPALFSGDLEDTLEIAVRNARAFANKDLDAVLVICATCGSGLKEGYEVVAQHLDGDLKDLVKRFSSKVQDLSVFLASRGLRQKLVLPEPFLVTYHDPCHHVRGQRISREPRELLLSIGNLTLKEMAEPARCCGGGGSFSLANPKLSIEIGRWKIHDILATGAQAVVTSCPGCVLQIQEVASREKAKFRVLHLVELLDKALEEK
jgi:glycolate oxidase iron-sulfur subunit